MTDKNNKDSQNGSQLEKRVGPPVEKKNFWDRKEELENLIELLDEGANVLITAQRRIGKTSLVKETINRINDRYICLFLDLEKCRSPQDVIAEISAATRPHLKLWDRTKEVFKNALASALENIDSMGVNDLNVKFRDALIVDWQKKADRLIQALAESGMPVVIFMDEFPLVVDRILKGYDFQVTPERKKEADAFLSWIRSVTIQYDQKLRMVLTGSIGLEPILQQAGLSHTVNTFTPFELRPWDQDIALELLKALALTHGVEFAPGAAERMVFLIGLCIPHHVQMFFNDVYLYCKKRGVMTCTPKDADLVYKSGMLSPRGHVELSTYEERLKIVLSREILPLALELLTEAAVAGKLTPAAIEIISRDFSLDGIDNGKGDATDKAVREAVNEIFHILEHNGLLVRQKKNYIFNSKLLRDWWKARFGGTYILAGRRNT